MNAERMKGRRLTAIDLFAGCGGLSYGLRAAGFVIQGAIENDPIAAKTYKTNHRNVTLFETDIRDVNPIHWMRELGLKKGELDLLAGCPPCQGFSTLRTRNGAKRNRDKRNQMVDEVYRFVRSFLPKVVLMENVPGLRNHIIFSRLRSKLRELGYSVHFKIEDAQYFGVPQRRKRLVMLASREVKVAFAARAIRQVSVRDAIGRLSPNVASGDPLHDFSERRTQKTRKLIASIPPNGGSRLDLPVAQQLPCHQGFDGHKDTYGRMSWDAVSPTITTGCFNPSKGRFIHPKLHRCITMREAALLQSFPASFRVAPGTTKTQAAKMIGNAFPPEFARRQAVEIRRALLRATLG